MAEVGVLNLTIRDNSEEAGKGLDLLAGALGRVKRACDPVKLENVADALKRVSSAIERGANSYRTLSRLATSLERVKIASQGFKLPDFSRLEGLARSLQDNFNAENGLKRIAEGMEAIKRSGEGFKMPGVKGIEKVIAAMNGGTTDGKSATPMESVREDVKEVTQSYSQLDGAVQTAKEGFAEIVQSSETVQNAVGNMDVSNLPISSLGMTMRDASEGALELGQMTKDSFETIRQAGMLDSVKGIQEMQQEETGLIVYTDNLANSWENVAARIDEAKRKQAEMEAASATEAYKTACEGVADQVGITNLGLEEQIRLREEATAAMQAENQARLERNYESYRELYLSGEGGWQQQVPEMYGFTPTAIEQGKTYAEALALTMEEVNRYVDEYIAKMNEPPQTAEWFQAAIDASFDAKEAFIKEEEVIDAFKDMPQVAEGMQQVASASQSMSGAMENSKTATRVLTDNMAGLDKELKQKKTDMAGVEESSSKLSEGFTTLFNVIKKSPLGKLAKQFMNIAKRMAIRAIIRQVTSAFREGVENVYHYSQAVGTDFATSMDNAATSLQTMKNSIGAAVAPVISALIPYLQIVVNWFITLINYVNQFFALLNGQSTWTKALDVQTSAYDDNTKAAKNASSAAQDLLADWDELNIIQSSSSGSGSGTTKTDTDYASMFTEVSEYNETIRNLVDGIEEEFGSIWTIAKKIAAVLLTWKISTAFSGVLGMLSSMLATLGIVDLEFHIVSMFDSNFLKTGEEGWLVADVLTTILGGVLMKKVLTKVLGASAAKIAIPLTLAVSAFAGITTLLGDTDTSALSPEALELSALTALKGGALVGYLTYTSGFTGGLSFGVGTAASLFFMGINVGLKAIADTVEAGEITKDTIKANLLSASLVAAGLMIGEAMVGGTIGTILAIGGVSAIATLGALFAIEAVLSLKEENPIQWGSYEATEAEIKAFVDDEIFSGAPSVEISLANAKIEELGDKKTELETSMSEVLGALQVAKLGLSPDAKTDLQTELKTFMDTFNSTTDTYQDALKIAVSLVPVSTDDGTDSKTIVQNSDSRWGELNRIMNKLAGDLTAQFDIAYNNELDEVTRKNAQESIEKISRMMTQISDAISYGQAKAGLVHNINKQISNLTQDSMDSMIQYYQEQREELIKQLTQTNEDAAEGLLSQYYAYEKLAEYALKEAGGDTSNETYQYYLAQANSAMDDYKALMEDLRGRAEEEADRTLGEMEGSQKIREALLGLITKTLPTDVEELMSLGAAGDADIFGAFIKGLLDGSEEGDATQEMSNFFDNLLYELVGGENIETFRSALDAGLISYSDLFNKDIVDVISKAFQIPETGELREKWNEVISSFFKDNKPEVPPTVVEQTYEVESKVEQAESTSGVESPMEQVTEQVESATEKVTNLDSAVEDAKQTILTLDEVQFNTKNVESGADSAASAIEGMASRIRNAFASLDGLSYDMDVNGQIYSGAMRVLLPVEQRASGGFVKSGDLVLANENGNFEMMGKMGNQPVVANNQQIVSGISQGVASANSDVVSELQTLTSLMQRLVNKGITATAVPSSSWGAHSAKSSEAYKKVTG